MVFSAHPVSAAIAEGAFCVPETVPSNPTTEPPTDYVAPRRTDFVGPLLPPTRPNHNAGLPPDVNADGLVTPLDALRLTNKYNAARTAGIASGEPVGIPAPAKAEPLYWDVNDDGRFTPLDILLVVNWINSHGSPVVRAPALVAEGEADPSAASPAAVGMVALDPASGLELQTELIDANPAVCYPEPAGSTLPEEAAPATTTELGPLTAAVPERQTQPSEDEDLLALLAVDFSSKQGLFYGPLPADATCGELGSNLAA